MYSLAHRRWLTEVDVINTIDALPKTPIPPVEGTGVGATRTRFSRRAARRCVPRARRLSIVQKVDSSAWGLLGPGEACGRGGTAAVSRHHSQPVSAQREAVGGDEWPTDQDPRSNAVPPPGQPSPSG